MTYKVSSGTLSDLSLYVLTDTRARPGPFRFPVEECIFVDWVTL